MKVREGFAESSGRGGSRDGEGEGGAEGDSEAVGRAELSGA